MFLSFAPLLVNGDHANHHHPSTSRLRRFQANLRSQPGNRICKCDIFSDVQGGESDGQFVHDTEWGSQGIKYMATLRNQIASLELKLHAKY
ncbi:hypothetical protein Hanom_Chr02g00117621 [Helianthus anomalus]